jgi:signal transduction histidine kinase
MSQDHQSVEPAEAIKHIPSHLSIEPVSSTSAPAFLAGGGEMGERIRVKDWAQTPLGPVEQWPQSLKTIVRIMLTSRQPIWIGWGPDLIKLYNDPYKAIVGGKHPGALGQPAAVVWQEVWADLGPRLQMAFQDNVGTYDESLLLIMERYGYQEETYYTFSYSPVPGDQDGVGGIICANTDDTRRIIGERQVKLLQTLAAHTADARTIEDACHRGVESLLHNSLDLPFALLYLLDEDRDTLSLKGTAGIQPGHPAAPERVALDIQSCWPLQDVLRTGKSILVSDLSQQFVSLPTGAWLHPPRQAAVIPIAHAGQPEPAGVFIVGLNPFRLFDEGYQGFLNLVTGQIAASLANAQAYEEERKRAEALAEIDRAKTAFFSNVSHEFRTPLTLMLGPIEEMYLDPETQGLMQARVEIAHRNALRLLKLVNSLLDFSRIEAGRVQAVYEPTDLASLTADLASSFRSAIERAGMQLLLACPALSEPVYVDQDMWEKIVLNLLSNAFKYTLHGKITVTLEQQETAVVLSVQDTGIGIPSEEMPHMFERFHRVAGNEGRTHEGTGIGLSFVYELVNLHGGTINVTSVQGQGSTFRVSLPLGTAHLPQERIATSHTHTSPTVNAQVYVEEAFRLLAGQEEVTDLSMTDDTFSSDGRQVSTDEQDTPARILFADDNTDMRAYVGRLLRPRYIVQTVPNGKAALAAVQANPPDLVLTDIMMPEMDGLELLHALRSNVETRSLPVILLSARAGEEDQIQGMQAGVDDYLTKPFSARELLARVGAHLEMARIRKEAEKQIEALLRQKDEFLGIASHELKTPVTSLKGYTQLLERRFRQVGDDRSSLLLRKMDAQINKLTHLINDLLDVTKIESGHLLFQKTTFDANTLIQEVVEEVQRTTSRHNIVLELAASATLFADRDRIGQVLTNLLTNAIKYAPYLETIIVKTVLTETTIIISVQDFGIGIPEEKQAHIFERFFRVEGDMQLTYPGLGLGLYIAAEFIKRHHGSIWVKSKEGEGTTILFSLLHQTCAEQSIVEGKIV